MKLHFRLVLVFLLVCAIVYMCFKYNDIRTTNQSLGNRLCEYTFGQSTPSVTPSKPIIPRSYINNGRLYDFYSDFEETYEKPPGTLPSKFRPSANKAWSSVDSEGYEEYWRKQRPQLRKAYDSIFKRNVEDGPVVIHFRCSDTPFNQVQAKNKNVKDTKDVSSEYHIPKLDYVKHIADEMLDKGYNEAIFLDCKSHRVKEEKNESTCSVFENIYIDYLEQRGITITPHCGSIMDDFEEMVYSKLLVSLNESSYSFMAGISKDPYKWITPYIGYDKEGEDSNPDWNMFRKNPLSHEEVVKKCGDYYNVKCVQGLISSPISSSS